MPRRLRAGLVLTIAVLLTACTTSAPGGDSGGGAAEPPASAGAATADEPGQTASAESEMPATCSGIDRTEDEVTDGATLGTCMYDAMTTAGSGRMRSRATGEDWTESEFEFAPEFRTHVSGDQLALVLHEDTGWMRTGGRWVQSDPSSRDPEVMMATGILDATRVFSSVQMLVSTMDACPGWVSRGRTEAPGTGQQHGEFACSGTFTVLGVQMSDFSLWLDDDFLGVHQVATGRFAGMSTRTEVEYRDWGRPVEIPTPG